MDFARELLAQPIWLVVWIAWMGLVNMASVAFLDRSEARWSLAAFATAFVGMNLIYAAFGYVRLLGLAHVLCWTPLLMYLWPRLPRHPRGSLYRAWLHLIFVTNAISLVIDYLDVARYVLGERS